jgi:hypothetical protein
MRNTLSAATRCLALAGGLFAAAVPGRAQQPTGAPFTTVSLTDLSAFQNAGANWKIVGDVSADLAKKEDMTTNPGTGILVNLPTAQAKTNLLTAFQHGDIDVEFDFMMANHSNSGFYLQGRYEFQLADSWGVKNPSTGDCGGIYKRRELPSGRLYEGHAPRVNACKAPGLWQHVEISFQAPRFDASGKKIANAKVIRATMNGVVLHENVELTGPTGGPISEQEAATGPIMIQGDHGPVAFRNMKYRLFASPVPQLTNLKYKVYYGGEESNTFDKTDFSKAKVSGEGIAEALAWDVSRQSNNYALDFTGTLKTTEPGSYTFSYDPSGVGYLKVDGKEVLPKGEGNRRGSVTLQPGNHTVQIFAQKFRNFQRPGLTLYLDGPGFRQTPLHNPTSMAVAGGPDPILISANENTVTRCFMDYYVNGKRQKRIVHSVNVGTPSGLHYTFDLDNGALAQAWRGGYLNATPMWNDRGDGSSQPMGAITTFSDAPAFAVLTGTTQAWSDTLTDPTAFRPLGYDLDADNLPTFRYVHGGAEIEDAIRPEEGKQLTREITVKNAPANLYHRLASGADVVDLGGGTYAVDGKSYYVKVLDGQASVRSVNGKQELIAPVSGKLKYAIMM